MKVLVTGGAGFIGSHLCEALLQEGNTVFIFDSFNDYYNSQIKKNNVKEIMAMMSREGIPPEKLYVHQADIRDKKSVYEIMANEISIVIHLAAMAGVRYSIEKPMLYYDVNVMGTLNILEACKDNKVKNLIFASSSSVYGNNKKIPFSEDDVVDNPISPYAATKKSGELLCHTYHHLFGVNIACLRFFTVYGPRQRPDLAIYKFVNKILNNEEICLFGNGETQRDYTYIGDIVQGILKTIKWLSSNQVQYDIFNLGESRTITLNNMLETIEKAIGKKANKKIMPLQLGDVDRTYADIAKARKVLGYSPCTSFEEGIDNFVRWYKNSYVREGIL